MPSSPSTPPDTHRSAPDAGRDLGLTFAGGGSRAFYQVGLMEHWAELLMPRVAGIAACSAGAAMACMLVAERMDEGREAFTRERAGLKRNVQPAELLRGRRPLPHEGIYRRTLLRALEGDGLRRIQQAPFPVRILAAAPPARLGLAAGAVFGLALYQAEKRVNPKLLHPKLAPRLGFRAVVMDAREARSAEELVDFILASSAVPPVTAPVQLSGERVLDGSLIDNAPAFLLDELGAVKKQVVMLTRRYSWAVTGEQQGRFYCSPSADVPIERWDYREHAPVEATMELGRQDGARVKPQLRAYIDA
ncbi:MAG: patatin-like phospholipase family protein [Myxococcales bacterium]|nr:patatin-like phospholipase family protein [Myxococcales bacterium]MCA9579155.1 patatin-like phospholipase family protein [Myxococcales bacterium]MCB9625869.1 patatin-like phospholipase family protein [Sandaracinaceae bacterium]